MKSKYLVPLCATLCLAGPVLAQDIEVARVDSIFADLDNTHSPGCALGIVRDGVLELRRGYGLASLEHGVVNSSNTVFYIGSTSKQFVAASILLAAEQGHLSLDDDIRKFLPELPDWQAPVTIRHLIHHTSGVRDYLTLMVLAGMRFEDVHEDAEVIDLISRQNALNFAPGEEYLYSNSGYFLLAQIVQRTTGRSLRQFADENIFRPLGMTRTHFHDDRLMVVPGRATAYSRNSKGGFNLEFYLNFDKVGSGGLLTTVEDLARWDLNFANNQLGPGTLTEDMEKRGVLNSGEELDYAFGLVHGEHMGRPTISHGGAFMGFRAELLRYPDDGVSVICLCNVADAGPSARALKVAEVVFNDSPDEAHVEAETEEPAHAVEVPSDVLEGYVGHYREMGGMLLRSIGLDGGTLWYVRSDGSRTELIPSAVDTFQMSGFPFEIIFQPGTDGHNPRMVVSGSGGTTHLESYEPWNPSADELGEYSGSYYSKELDATYKFFRDKAELRVRIGDNSESYALRPVVVGEFAGDWFRIRFSTAGEELLLDTGRAKGFHLLRID